MTQTLTALYDTHNSAVSAVNALEASGIPHADISIVSIQLRLTVTQPTPTGKAANTGQRIILATRGSDAPALREKPFSPPTRLLPTTRERMRSCRG